MNGPLSLAQMAIHFLLHINVNMFRLILLQAIVCNYVFLQTTIKGYCDEKCHIKPNLNSYETFSIELTLNQLYAKSIGYMKE